MAKDRSKKKQMTMQRSISTEMLRISLLASVLLFLVSLVLFFSIRTLTDNRMKNLEYQVSVSSSENLRRTISMSMRHRTDNTAKQLRAAMISYSELTGSVADFAERLYAGEIKGSKDVLPPNSHTSGQLSVQLLYSEGTAPGDPEVVRELEQLSLVSSMMESTLRSYTEISAAYIATESGICIMADYQAAGKYDRNGRLKSYEARDRYWYHKAKETQEPGLVMMKNDWFLKEPLFTWFEPVFDANKQVVAVVGLDILLSDFSEVLNRNTSNQYQNICVADKNGAIVYSSMNSGILSHSSNYAWNLRACPNRELASIVKKAIEGESGASILEIDGGRSYLGYAPVEDYDMIVLTMLPYERIMDPTQELTEMIHEVSVEELATIDGLMRNGYLYILSQLLILESLTAIVAYLIAGQLVKSIRRLSQKVREVHGENLEFVWEDDSENEVANLAEAFSGLTKRLRYYISNITQETIQRERAKTELSLATHIQQSFLPDIDELFTEKDDYEIQAFMRTAREVGGDLYDAFFLDDDHLCMVVADVSDKGVPAGLFMVEAKTFLNGAAFAMGLPKDILFEVNNRLYENNKENLFVTIWLGILELSTGRILASNAGHEFPILKDSSGRFSVLEDEHGFVVGGLENIEYVGYELTLEKGQTLFLYTDGVPEAMNENGEQFGLDRTLAALNRTPNARPSNLLMAVSKDVREFVGGAKQFDDITILCIRRKP